MVPGLRVLAHLRRLDLPSFILLLLVLGLAPVWKSKIYGAFALNRRVDIHAIDAAPARWRLVRVSHRSVEASNSPVYLRTGDRMIQKEEFDDFVKELIGV